METTECLTHDLLPLPPSGGQRICCYLAFRLESELAYYRQFPLFFTPGAAQNVYSFEYFAYTAGNSAFLISHLLESTFNFPPGSKARFPFGGKEGRLSHRVCCLSHKEGRLLRTVNQTLLVIRGIELNFPLIWPSRQVGGH